jgi:CRP-like cAMP-binding protein
MSLQRNLIEQIELFNCLTENEKSYLAERSEIKVKGRYNYVYLADEPSTHLNILLKGTIKIGTHSNDGKEIIKSIIHPQAMFGEMSVMGQEKRVDFAKSMNSGVEYFTVDKKVFAQLMKSNAEMSSAFMADIGKRLTRAESRLESLIFKDARSRIIDFLKDSLEKRGRQVGFEVMFKHSLTQQDIANLTGTSRQTVTSVLNELKKENLIYFTRKSILVRDVAKLA